MLRALTGNPPSTPDRGRSESRARRDDPAHGEAGRREPLQLLPLRRRRQPKADSDMDLRDAIHRVALAWPTYGRPRITAELRRQGLRVNAKRGILRFQDCRLERR
jgi:hypothetical protein